MNKSEIKMTPEKNKKAEALLSAMKEVQGRYKWVESGYRKEEVYKKGLEQGFFSEKVAERFKGWV